MESSISGFNYPPVLRSLFTPSVVGLIDESLEVPSEDGISVLRPSVGVDGVVVSSVFKMEGINILTGKPVFESSHSSKWLALNLRSDPPRGIKRD